MINDFNNGMVGFTDWNILLDETGGPNHVQNFCFAPVHGDTRTGKLTYTNAYYYIGHFSKFATRRQKDQLQFEPEPVKKHGIFESRRKSGGGCYERQQYQQPVLPVDQR